MRIQLLRHQTPYISALFLLLHHSLVLSNSAGRLADTYSNLQEHGNQATPQQAVLHSANHQAGEYTSSQKGTHSSSPNTKWYSALLSALDGMQTQYYTCGIGTWPDAIDWTAEVMAAQVSTSLFVVSEGLHNRTKASTASILDLENVVNRYFTHITSFYFGEDAFSLRMQAYDDMLWVVLGWLESIRFINVHSNLHYSAQPSKNQHASENSSWYAKQFIPQFSHRAHVFYNLASRGWDTTLCGGGMVWNPRLTPYKNAITNELFITASIWMYLYFPGDSDSSPFLFSNNPASKESSDTTMSVPGKPHDPKYLHSAIKGYQWLKSSNMRNSAGLYVDGFHVRGWRGGKNPSKGTKKCDIRDEKVYTYNQGVVLSGLRGLWEATGNLTYLEDGHELVRAVISATGWANRDDNNGRWAWAGLGRGGVLEEECDWSGSCNQDGQNFKGIFFWHFSSFCSPLPTSEDAGWAGQDRPWLDDEMTRALHRQSCENYESWVKKNAQAAWVTRDENGLMGSWWGRHVPPEASSNEDITAEKEAMEQGILNAPPKSAGTDYRNEGVPQDEIWRLPSDELELGDDFVPHDAQEVRGHIAYPPPRHDPSSSIHQSLATNGRDSFKSHEYSYGSDPNNRGRGRTVETQSGGLSVIRAAWRMELQRAGQDQ